MNTEIKKFTLSIPYANTAGRNNAKKLGAKWDSDRKVWTVETTEKKIDLRNLSKFVVEESINTPISAPAVEPAKTVDSGCGFRMSNTAANWAKVNRYGFDAIEMVD